MQDGLLEATTMEDRARRPEKVIMRKLNLGFNNIVI